MPVILRQQDEALWLNENNSDNLLNMLSPYNPDEMDLYSTSKLVNSPYSNSKEIVIANKQPNFDKLSDSHEYLLLIKLIITYNQLT